MNRLAALSLLVPDYDEAIRFFTEALGFELREDTPLGGGKRWVRVAAAGGGTELLLARAANEAQRAAIGLQAGGRVFLFLHTDAFDRDLARLQAHGAQLAEAPRQEAYGRVVVFVDPWGNRWDLIQPAKGP